MNRDVRKAAFTLIELLIVVAIIGILAAIAIPNFLQAQVRAKVANAKAELRTMVTAANLYFADHGNLPPDSNAPDAPPDLAGLTWENENPGKKRDLHYRYEEYGQSFGHLLPFRAQVPLTTPIDYMSSIPTDAFSSVMPYLYDTMDVTKPDGSYYKAYVIFSSAGPDMTAGDWYRGLNPPAFTGILYDPTNGTVSRGDIWRGVAAGDANLYREHYKMDPN